jgi:hypothetical protein
MTLQDNYLEEVAKTLNRESSNLPAWIGVSDQDGGVTIASGDLTNEIGSRSSVTRLRNNKRVVYNGSRLSTDVVDTANGDVLEQIGFFGTETGSDLQLFIDLAPVTQTTDFDVEVTFAVNVDREV